MGKEKLKKTETKKHEKEHSKKNKIYNEDEHQLSVIDELKEKNPQIAIIMGSRSDWETVKEASEILKEFAVKHITKVVSAHRTPDLLYKFAEEAEAQGIQIIIAAAGGAAHLPGMVAAKTHLPVLGIPVQSKSLSGLDSLLSIVQMPGGIPVGTLAIGKAGAKNAALLAIAILSLNDSKLRKKLLDWRKAQTDAVLEDGEF
jgi:5-(carboxyamino)imidazole ribonucleotide mutase